MIQYILAHDLGTSGNKATLYSTDGKLVKSTVYSYDLITGEKTVHTEGKPVINTKIATNISRSDILYRELVAEAEKLLTLTKGLKGRTNKDKEKLITQIRELYNKWKD